MNDGKVYVSDLIAPAFMPVHRSIKAGKYAEYWLKGGRGSTKSSFIATEIILGIIKNPQANAIVYRKVASTLRESVYEELTKVIHRMGLEAFFKLRLSPLGIQYIPTGQKIMFRGADDPAKSKSIALSKGYFGFLWFEELAEFGGVEDIRTISASVIRGGKKAVTFCSYNPPMSAGNWVNKASLTQEEGRLVHASTYLDVPAAWLGEEFIRKAEVLKATNERAYRHMYLGEVTGTGGQVFDNLEVRRITDDEIAGYGRYYCGLDFGFAVDPDAFVRVGYDSRLRKLLIVDEFYASHNAVDKLAEQVRIRARGEAVRCDSADPRMISELKTRGVKSVGVKKGPGSVEHGMRWLQSQGKIIVDPARTPNAAKELSAYEYQRDKAGNFISDYPDKDNHTIDALRYALNDIIAARKLETMNKSLLGF